MLNTKDRIQMLERLENMTDTEILQNALNDPDALPMTDSELSNLIPVAMLPQAKNASLIERFRLAQKKENKVTLTVRYDADLVHWYKSHGKGYQSVMNAALRACMEAELQAELASQK